MIEISLHKKLHSPGGQMNLQVYFELNKGDFITLYGKSGAGKTSVLRMIAGLFQPDQGRISINGNEWFNSSIKLNLPPQKRKIGFVFQDYALFPNMSVIQNLQYALSKNQSPTIIEELTKVMELGDLRSRNPQTLSGGQRQRVALARALVQKPEILLLDEPLSALDKEMREKLQDYLLLVHRKYELTTILVSHDEAEIRKLANRVFFLENGIIVNQGEPSEVFGTRISGIPLIGKILSKTSKNDLIEAKINIQGNVFTLELSKKEAESLKVGEEIELALGIKGIEKK